MLRSVEGVLIIIITFKYFSNKWVELVILGVLVLSCNVLLVTNTRIYIYMFYCNNLHDLKIYLILVKIYFNLPT